MDDLETLNLNLDSLTIDEMETMEEITGAPFDEAFGAGKPKAKVLRALAFIIKRREDPDFTLEDAGKLAIRLDADPVPPTVASAS